MLRQCATTAITAVNTAPIRFAMAAMLGRLVAQLKMPRLDAYFESATQEIRRGSLLALKSVYLQLGAFRGENSSFSAMHRAGRL